MGFSDIYDGLVSCPGGARLCPPNPGRMLKMLLSNVPTPVSYHLDLYRYWDGKRGERSMAARRDIEPIDILPLLPHIAIIDRDDGGYRWRLMGTALAGDFGRDLTGQRFGGYVAPTPLVQAMIVTFDRVLAEHRPAFELTAYTTRLGARQSVSRLLVPLSTQDQCPGMMMFTRITRFQYGNISHDDDQLKEARGRLIDTHPIQSIEQLESLANDWELSSSALGPPVRRVRNTLRAMVGPPV